jgi:hypothetical protein
MTDLETVELAARRALVKTNDASIKAALKLLADEIASIICERAQPRRHLATPWGWSMMTRNEKLYLSRRVCALCEQRLDRSSCGAIWPPRCTEEQMEACRQAALRCYRPRKRPFERGRPSI